MSCDLISSGRAGGCKDAVGGLLNVYFVNYSEANDAGVDDTAIKFTEAAGRYEPTTERIISPTVAPETKPKAYKYALHLGNDLTQNIQSSAENGTLYFEQIVNLTLKKLSNEDNVQIKILSSGTPYVFVEDQMGNVMLVGRVNGADVTGGTAVTGNDFGDLNGYTLAITAKEGTLANFYASPDDTAPGDFFSDFDIQEGV